jgi:thioredoxin reductase
MEPLNRRALLEALKECNVCLLAGHKAVEVTGNGVVVADTVSGEKKPIEAGRIILAVGSEPQRGLAECLAGKSREFYEIGDCAGTVTILEAVRDAFLRGHRI